MLKVVYSPNGQPISDFEAYNVVDNLIANYISKKPNLQVFETSNELIISILSLRILEDVLSSSEVEFYKEDILLSWDDCLGINLEVNGKIIDFGFFSAVTSKSLDVACTKIKKRAEGKI